MDELMHNMHKGRWCDSPRIVTTTGLVLRLSGSGNVMATVRTDPKLVPIHKVGNKSVGSKHKKDDDLSQCSLEKDEEGN